jgi:hypothetical protein
MVVTTVDQDLNREIADFAYDMAEVTGGKVFLLNVWGLGAARSSWTTGP